MTYCKTQRMNMKSLMIVIVYFTPLLFCTHVTRTSLAKPGCQEKCGKLTIPYPYGIGTNCYSHKSFEVLCDGSVEDIAPLRFVNNHGFPILEISTESVRVVAKEPFTSNISVKAAFKSNVSWYTLYSRSVQLDRFFRYSHDQNVYVAVGCNCQVYFQVFNTSFELALECTSLCFGNIPPKNSSDICTGKNGCCQSSVPVGTRAFRISKRSSEALEMCSGALITEKNNVRSILSNREIIRNSSVALNWVIALHTCREAKKRWDSLCGQNSHCIDSSMGIGYNCRCMEGYEGNPYLPSGCQDINKCQEDRSCTSGRHHKFNISGNILTAFGLSAFSAFGYLVYIEYTRRKNNTVRKKFFKRNGGNLLKQQISADNSCVRKIKIYDAEEMERATDGFSRHRFLGKGGQGTVYKGLLLDGTVVAIKKSNIIDEDEVVRFVNEVLILAQIHHRNIVKLIGCCLEYEVPLLVYEYLSNGTLSQHLHDGFDVSKFLWKDRVRIAREVAEALAYLHSYASPTIFHRDIKPGNILLDENYNAVVSDFGLSRSVPLSRTHVTTQIEGTFGYLDPEYFQSGKLTAKSDVYAFGVILAELLSRQKAISLTNTGEGLVPRFQYLIKNNLVISILDMQIVQEARMDDVLLLAKLANRCMKKNAKKRPSMKEVVAHCNQLKVI